MFRTILVFCCLFTLQTASAQKKRGWKLVWQEEFNYTGLPDSTKWEYEEGHIRNHEQQYYTKARKENSWVADGVLTITGRKEPYPNAAYTKGANAWQKKDSLAQYTSASINTLGKAGFTYGRVEMKAKLPKGGGIWPAFWMMGISRSEVGWPRCGEIDIMEFIGKTPNDVYGTMHYPDPATKQKASMGKHTSDSTLTDFHIYAVEWSAQKIDVYFDNTMYFSFPVDAAGTGADNPFRKEFYILLNLALGGDWPGPADPAVMPQAYVIDYVRVYRKK